MINRLIRLPEVKKSHGRGRSTIYARVADGLFPPPIKLGRSAAWLESEIAEINSAHIAGASDDEIRELVTRLVADRKKAAA